MPYSSEQFTKDWVHSVAQDFKSPNGEAAQWAPGQPARSGDERSKIALSHPPRAVSVNADGTLMAVGQEHDIHVFCLKDLSLLQVLKGHISCVDAIEFHPRKPNTLVSCAMCQYGGSVQVEPSIVFWNLDQRQTLLDEAVTKDLSARAMSVVAGGLEDSTSTWTLNQSEREALTQDVGKSLTTLNIKSQLHERLHIHGRLAINFGSHVFNGDGSSMVYLPGQRPRSNDVQNWEICVWDTVKQAVKHILTGHTDSITWMGFSPNDECIASVSWDKTFRIWSHTDGQLLHIFRSNGQNATGEFSPDSRFFAGTSGEGRFWIWDVVHGMEVATHGWIRSYGCLRSLAWRPDGKQLVIGGRPGGCVFVYDIKRQSIVQERLLSLDKCPEKYRYRPNSFLEISATQYFDGGRKIAYKNSSDSSVEVYDFRDNRKWRFAPEGTASAYGPGFFVLEEQGLIASMDADAVRFWGLPLGSEV